MRISDIIAEFINAMLKEEGGMVELQRSELAEKFKCVPSQINYVIDTRFSPEHGFFVESRRGGGGYIRISRVKLDKSSHIVHILGQIGEEIDSRTTAAFISDLYAANVIDKVSAEVLLAVLSERALLPVPAEVKAALRARMLKSALLSLARE